MDGCSLEIPEMEQVVHLRYVFRGRKFPSDIIILENDLSIPGRFYEEHVGPKGTVKPQSKCGHSGGIYGARSANRTGEGVIFGRFSILRVKGLFR